MVSPLTPSSLSGDLRFPVITAGMGSLRVQERSQMAEPTRLALSEALLKVRKRIQQVRDRKEGIGEENTKATLIDPILSCLGWDLQELDEVSREYKRRPQDNPVDYAL